MKISITHELIVFLSMTALGLFEGFVFDVFRVVRKNISKTFWKVSITDVGYWFVSGAIFAVAVWKVTPTKFLYKMVLRPIIVFLKRKIGCVSKIRNMRKSGIRNDKKTK